MATNPARLTAQIACEYIVNHRAEGWSQQDRRTVLAQACDTGVGDFYVDAVSEEIQFAAVQADSDSVGGALL